MRRLLPLALVSLLAPAPALAQHATAEGPAPERHSEVLLYAPTDGALTPRLAAHGLVLDHVRHETTARGTALRTVLSETELATARAAGVEIDVLVEDLTAHYLATRQGTCEQGRLAVSRIEANLCGPMGGYLTFSGVVAALDALRAAYPEVVSVKRSLGRSHEGRDIWMVEIGDNPGADEGEPEVLYTGVHHACEPGSMMAVLYFMHYLAEQYGSNPEVTALVDTRRLFFVPVLNPDGYVYNETTNPEGGGMWRKNRRPNRVLQSGAVTYGVDLNRNYGYQWGYNDAGSSPNPASNLYRGPAPFSEPELQALRDFLEGRRVGSAINYHSYGIIGDVRYPWSYTDDPAPDDDALRALAAAITAPHQVYRHGSGPNGEAGDWMYGEGTTKPEIFAFTAEVCYDFWPDPYNVYPCAEQFITLEMNLRLAERAATRPFAYAPAVTAPSGLTLEVRGPNPLRQSTEVAFALPEAAPVRLVLYDALGREVAVLADEVYAAGRHPVALDASGLARGVYALRLLSADETVTRLLTVAR